MEEIEIISLNISPVLDSNIYDIVLTINNQLYSGCLVKKEKEIGMNYGDKFEGNN